ncbi:hypothetical protein ACFQZ4_31690 [Catellatospora coxensis]
MSAMAAPARARQLHTIEEWTEIEEWTADLALQLLPETNGRKIEVFRGSVIVSPTRMWIIKPSVPS